MSYKSALSPVFSQVFGIHIDDKIYESLFKSFCLKRPYRPLHNPVDWDLDAVLKFIVSFPRTLSVHDLMSKGALLLFLVSAGRCSEIAALSRHPSHIKKLSDGSFSILPLPSFLAKNENPSSRFNALVVKPLPSEELLPLCPVNVIDEILSVPTKDDSTLSLLLNPSSLDNITISKLRFLVCALIKRACPNSFPKSHDIRKIASSTLLLGANSLNSVIAHCKWHSAKAFIKHYLLDSLKPNQLSVSFMRAQAVNI